MRVFVTGATGFIGFPIVKELLAAGHQVMGLARSKASGEKLVEVGAQVQVGTVDDLEGLRQGASSADGAIHTAFYHQLAHVPLGTRLRVFLGGAPSGIVRGSWEPRLRPIAVRLRRWRRRCERAAHWWRLLERWG